MRPSSRDNVLAAVDQLAKSAGETSFEAMMENCCTMLEKLAAFLSMMRTREKFTEALDSMEATPIEEKLLLASIKMTPMLIGFGLKKVAKNAAKEFPAPTGRKHGIGCEKYVEVIDFVSKLNRDGVEVGDCIYRASRKFQMGVRSVERIWHHRAEILQNGPEPHFDDVVRKISEHVSGN